MTDKVPESPTDIYFLDLSETCLYMVHFGLGLGLFSERTKNFLHCPKVNIQ